jgi:small subunit ribosomal protein S7
MPRRGAAPRRHLMPDPVYKSVLVTQVVNKILMHGKKTTAESIVYRALDIVGEKTDGDSLAALKRAVDNVKPQLEVKSRRAGFARNRRERTMAERLAAELLDASNGIGSAVKRKEDTHKMAESNKAYAHYRW